MLLLLLPQGRQQRAAAGQLKPVAICASELMSLLCVAMGAADCLPHGYFCPLCCERGSAAAAAPRLCKHGEFEVWGCVRVCVCCYKGSTKPDHELPNIGCRGQLP
jgi:hypothetical protein